MEIHRLQTYICFLPTKVLYDALLGRYTTKCLICIDLSMREQYKDYVRPREHETIAIF